MRKEVIAETQDKCVGGDESILPVAEELSFYGSVNGIQVGKVWESRTECSAAGIHIPLDRDIHVGTDGLYSMLLCGASKDNLDYGECITCSVTVVKSKSLSKNESDGSENPKLNLSKNYDSGNPVRVIRSRDLKSPYAADKGFRYDGLYIVRKLCKLISDDGQYSTVKYSLKRRENQSVVPWREHQSNEISSLKNISPVTSPFVKQKDFPYKTREKTFTTIDPFASVCKRSAREPSDAHSCMKKKLSPHKKYVTFEDEFSDITKSSFKEYLTRISKKLDDKIGKSAAFNWMNSSSLKLSVTDKSGAEPHLKQSSGVNPQLMYRVPTNSSNSTSVKMEKEKTSHTNTEKKRDNLCDSTENDIGSKNSDLQQQKQDSSQTESHKKNEIITVDNSSSAEPGKQKVKESTAKMEVNVSIKKSRSNSKLENMHQEQNSKEKSMGDKMVNKSSVDAGNDVKLNQISKKLSVSNVETKQFTQEITDNVDSVKKPKQNSSDTKKSVPSTKIKSTVVDSHLLKQDSLQISSKGQNDKSVNASSTITSLRSKQILRMVSTTLSSSSAVNKKGEKTRTSTQDEKTETSTLDEKIQTSATQNEKTQTSTKDGKTQTSTKDGKTQTSTKDGKTQTSTEDGKTQTSTQESVIETIDVTDHFSAGCDFGKSVNSLCLQLSELETKQCKSSPCATEKLHHKQNSQKQSSPVKDTKAKKHRTVPELDNIHNKRRKHVNSEVEFPRARQIRSTRLLNPVDYNTLLHLNTRIGYLKKEVNGDIPHVMHTSKENKSDGKCILKSNEDSSIISPNEHMSSKLYPVVNLVRLSDEHLKEISSPNKNIKESSRKRKHNSRDMKGKRGLRDCHVVLQRLQLPYCIDENDPWCGWQVHDDSLRNACDADMITILDGNTQYRTLIWGRDDDIVPQVENDSVEVVMPRQLGEEPDLTDEWWKGWYVINAQTNIGNSEEESGWFNGW